MPDEGAAKRCSRHSAGSYTPSVFLTVTVSRNLSVDQCESALAALMASGFLAETRDGAYVRRERMVGCLSLEI